MKLTVYNGSPRGKGANSNQIINSFLEGLRSTNNNTAEVHHLIKTKDIETHVKAFSEAEKVLIVFPLYTDAMPGIVMNFIEALEPFCGKHDNPEIGFIIHSGFPEALQLHALEQYLQKLSERLNCPYLGTVIKGGSEMLKGASEEQAKPLLDKFHALGDTFGKTCQFDEVILENLAQPEKLPGWAAFLFSLVSRLPVLNQYWNDELKKNGVYKERFARPYQD